MIVVCNTSPLTNLATIGQFDLLHQLYKELHIAQGVWDELNASGKIDAIRPFLDGLRQTAGFYLSTPVYERVLTLTGEKVE